jgi:ABC-type uncharacterized transport system ATPase subunit
VSTRPFHLTTILIIKVRDYLGQLQFSILFAEKNIKREWRLMMKIEKIQINGFRNFCEAEINFNEKTLVIGANDVGKTNLLYALRMLLKRRMGVRSANKQ